MYLLIMRHLKIMRNFQRFLFLIVNSLFVAKYTIRLGYNPVVFTCLYCLFILLVWWLLSKKDYYPKIAESRTLYFSVLSLLFVGIILLHCFIDPLKLQVDRWSAIHNFIQNLFAGIYPYSAHTHLGGYGSPFPVWQVFHIPFYLLGNVGLAMLFSVILLSVFLVWFFDNYHQALFYIILLFISPVFWYEVGVRSDLLYNFILCFIAIGFVYKKKYTTQKNALGLGLLCGFFLSSRLVVIIPFTIYLLPDFIFSTFKKKLIFGVTAILIFVISFVPFLFLNFNTMLFFEYNPFILQTRQGFPLEMILIAVLATYLSFKWKNNFMQYSSYTSLAIVILVLSAFLHRMIADNFVNGLFDSGFDITYFDMALPFIVFTLAIQNQLSLGQKDKRKTIMLKKQLNEIV
jgi:hypothetical protein